MTNLNEMRRKITVLLLLLSLILALLPLTANRSFTGKPATLLKEVLAPGTSVNADQVARLIVSEDSTLQLIDLRTPEEFRRVCIPGSINVPYPDFVRKDPDIYLNNKNMRTLFYSDDDFDADYAMVYARGLGYNNCFTMEGGLKAWINTIMDTKYAGERISARENSLYEVRTKAGKLFTEFNSQPDSLKARFMESKKFSARKLDGGCE